MQSTEQLLVWALMMLEKARDEQFTSNRQDKWLTGNMTMTAIRNRVAGINAEDSSNDH